MYYGWGHLCKSFMRLWQNLQQQMRVSLQSGWQWVSQGYWMDCHEIHLQLFAQVKATKYILWQLNTIILSVIKQHKTKIQQTYLSGTLTTITTFVRRWDVMLGKTSALKKFSTSHMHSLCVYIVYWLYTHLSGWTPLLFWPVYTEYHWVSNS